MTDATAFAVAVLAGTAIQAWCFTGMTAATWRWARAHERRLRELEAMRGADGGPVGPARRALHHPAIGRGGAIAMTWLLLLFYVQAARLVWWAVTFM